MLSCIRRSIYSTAKPFVRPLSQSAKLSARKPSVRSLSSLPVQTDRPGILWRPQGPFTKVPAHSYSIARFFSGRIHDTTSLTTPLKPAIGENLFYCQEKLAQLMSPEDFTKWTSFIRSGTVFVMHEGHCANTLITKLTAMGVSNIVLVSSKDECSAENRVAGSVIINDFNDLETNYTAMEKYCKKNNIEKARVLVGWGYSSESKEVPIQNERVRTALAKDGCDFDTPCNSVKTLNLISEKDDFDRTIHELGLPGIPNYGVTYGEAFDDNPKNVFKFVRDLFNKYPNKHTLLIYFKHPSCGGGRGIHAIRFNHDDLENISDTLLSEITQTISRCHKEGAAFLQQNETRKLVLQMGIENAFHIEAQLIGKKVMGLRECSAQERGQKKAEGTVPAYLLSDKKKEEIISAAQHYANNTDLSGPNTLELLCQVPDDSYSRDLPIEGNTQLQRDNDPDIFFLEDNARLQVEHPVSERNLAICIVAAMLADNQGINLAPFLAHSESNSVRHIRLTALTNGEGKILTSQEEMQSIMDDTFGAGTVTTLIKQMREINPLADQQFGALLIQGKTDVDHLALNVLRKFEDHFQSTGLVVPYRSIYAVLNAYIKQTPFQVGQYIPPESPSDTEITKARLTQIIDKGLNENTVKGEQPIQRTTEDFQKLERELTTLFTRYEDRFPPSSQTDLLSEIGWDPYWNRQDKVNLSAELRDWLQSLLSHVTHPSITKAIQRVVNRLPSCVTMQEAVGVSGAGPQTSAVLHTKDPSSNRVRSEVPVFGLERGKFMNGLQEATDVDRAAMKYISHKIEEETYGTFRHQGKTYSAYVVTDFHAPNNARLNARMVFENMVYGRPSYMTLAWNPTMKMSEIQKYARKQFSEYADLQNKSPELKVPDPMGYYIKCPSTTDTITPEILIEVYRIIDEEYLNRFRKRIANIKCQMHNLPDGKNKDHQTRVAQSVMTNISEDPEGPRLTLAGTFPVGGYGASHPDLNQLCPKKDIPNLEAAREIVETINKMIESFDVSDTVTPLDSSFEGPGGMAATAYNDLIEVKNRYPDNEAIQRLTYEDAINLGVGITGMRTLVTPISQYNFLFGIEVARCHGSIVNGELDVGQTKDNFLQSLNNGKIVARFPEPVMKGIQNYDSDFPNPRQATLDKLLKLSNRTTTKTIPTVYLEYNDRNLDVYRLELEKVLGFPPTNEDILTALRFGTQCPFLVAKSTMGAGSEVMPAEDFFTQRKLKEGDTLYNAYQIKRITTQGLTFVVTVVDRDGKETIIPVPNNKETATWVRTQLSSTPKYDPKVKHTFPFNPLIGAKVTASFPSGTTISKETDGTITYKDKNGCPLQPLDPLNPSSFCEVVIMKMQQSQLLPPDLEVGDHVLELSPYFESLIGTSNSVHPGTKGYQAFALKTSDPE
ncbi:hypothetical protein HOH45_00990 [bacterium]|nr:hypothetical protein [bacterium]